MARTSPAVPARTAGTQERLGATAAPRRLLPFPQAAGLPPPDRAGGLGLTPPHLGWAGLGEPPLNGRAEQGGLSRGQKPLASPVVPRQRCKERRPAPASGKAAAVRGSAEPDIQRRERSGDHPAARGEGMGYQSVLSRGKAACRIHAEGISDSLSALR